MLCEGGHPATVGARDLAPDRAEGSCYWVWAVWFLPPSTLGAAFLRASPRAHTPPPEAAAPCPALLTYLLHLLRGSRGARPCRMDENAPPRLGRLALPKKA